MASLNPPETTLIACECVLTLTCQSAAELPKLERQRGDDRLVHLWRHLARRHDQRNHDVESVVCGTIDGDTGQS